MLSKNNAWKTQVFWTVLNINHVTFKGSLAPSTTFLCILSLWYRESPGLILQHSDSLQDSPSSWYQTCLITWRKLPSALLGNRTSGRCFSPSGMRPLSSLGHAGEIVSLGSPRDWKWWIFSKCDHLPPCLSGSVLGCGELVILYLKEEECPFPCVISEFPGLRYWRLSLRRYKQWRNGVGPWPANIHQRFIIARLLQIYLHPRLFLLDSKGRNSFLLPPTNVHFSSCSHPTRSLKQFIVEQDAQMWVLVLYNPIIQSRSSFLCILFWCAICNVGNSSPLAIF